MALPTLPPAPALPTGVICANILICEKVLREEDNVSSIIRLVDLFYFTRPTDQPLDRQAVLITALLTIKTIPENQNEHEVELHLIRPSGSDRLIGETLREVFTSKFPETPGGFNLLAPIPVLTKEEGTHLLVAYLDGVEVARTPFTLLEKKPEGDGIQK
jgi:hypothetical protein